MWQPNSRAAEALVRRATRPQQQPAKVLQKAEDEAKRMGDEYVSAEHLLLGILDGVESGATKLLTRFGVTKDRVYEASPRFVGDSV